MRGRALKSCEGTWLAQHQVMNAIELLKRDHDRMKVLLTRAVTAGGEQRREHLLADLHRDLVTHERLEEELLYPKLQENPRTREIVLEGYEEHHVADQILDELLETPPDTDVWKAKMKVLKESIEHHIEEEERDMFKKARKVLTDAELEQIGEQMEMMRRETAA